MIGTSLLDKKLKSTIAAETLALNEGAEYGVYLAHILRQLIDGITVKVKCYMDNKTIVDAITSKKTMNII